MSPAGKVEPARRAVRRYVLDDERIVLATRHHWARLLEPVATAAVAFVVVALSAGVARQAVGARGDLLWWLWVAVLVRTALRFVAWHVEWFVATDRRMLLLTGIVTHRVAMMPLHKVTDMSYARSVLGQVLGYGEFVLESAGQDQAMRRIQFVPRPDRSYRTLCATIFAPGGAPPRGPAAAGARPELRPTGLPPVIRPVAPPARPVSSDPEGRPRGT